MEICRRRRWRRGEDEDITLIYLSICSLFLLPFGERGGVSLHKKRRAVLEMVEKMDRGYGDLG